MSTPGQRVFHRHSFHRFSTTFHTQGHTASMTYRVQRSCGHGWEGKADRLPVPAFNTLTPMVHPAAVCWFPWFFTILSHNNKFPTAAFQPQSFNRVNRLLNISVALTLSPYVSLTFLPNVGIEIPEYNCQSVLRWSFPLDFWRKSRAKRSFWRLDT